MLHRGRNSSVEAAASAGILNSMFERGLSCPDSDSGQSQTATVQRILQRLIASILASDKRLRRQVAIVESHRPCRRIVQAYHILLVCDCNAFPTCVHIKQAHAAAAIARTRLGAYNISIGNAGICYLFVGYFCRCGCGGLLLRAELKVYP